MSLRALVIVVVLAGIAGGTIVVWRTGTQDGSARGPVIVTVDRAHPGRVVPRSFLGLSIEYSSVPAYTGRPGLPNRAFIGLVRALGAAQHSPVALRIGGNSSDETWWNPSGRPRPRGVLTSLDETWVRSLAMADRRLRSPISLGLNLALGDRANAIALVRAVQHELPSSAVRALEVGNEPDLYPNSKTFRVGRLVITRPRQRERYDADAYVREASRFLDALARHLRPTPLLGIGGFATAAWTKTAVPRLLTARRYEIGQLLAHAYALTECDPNTGTAELRARLLTDAASRGLVEDLRPSLDARGSRGLPTRVAELNSAVCGGVHGVSDTLAAALWIPDALFALAAAGARQVDVHTWAGAFYAPFAFGANGRRDEADVRPLYYGMLLYARAAPAGSRLLPTTVDRGGSDVRAWATTGAGRTARVLLVNRSATTPHQVRVRLGRSGGSARLELLRGPGLQARAGVTLAGQGVAGTTRSGRLRGQQVVEIVPVHHGVARLHLPATAAGLLVVS